MMLQHYLQTYTREMRICEHETLSRIHSSTVLGVSPSARPSGVACLGDGMLLTQEEGGSVHAAMQRNLQTSCKWETSKSPREI